MTRKERVEKIMEDRQKKKRSASSNLECIMGIAFLTDDEVEQLYYEALEIQ